MAPMRIHVLRRTLRIAIMNAVENLSYAPSLPALVRLVLRRSPLETPDLIGASAGQQCPAFFLRDVLLAL